MNSGVKNEGRDSDMGGIINVWFGDGVERVCDEDLRNER